MRLRNEAKVGLIVFAAFVALIAIYWFLGGFGLRASSYPIYAIFPDAQKLDKGADVRLAGVKVGIVSGVNLTDGSRARVDMLIWNGTRIPKTSAARITTGGFIGDNYVEIIPGSGKKYLRDGDRITGRQLVQFDQLMQGAGDLLKELRTSAKSINQLLGDKEMVASIKGTIKDLKKSADAASELMASVQNMVTQSSPAVRDAFDNLAAATGNAVKVSKEIEEMIAEDTRPNVRAIMAQTRDATKGLNESIASAKELIDSFKDTSGKLAQTLSKADSAAAQAQQMMCKLNEAAGGVRDLATDKELQCNLRTTMKNAAEASKKANELLDNLNRKFGGRIAGPTAEQKASIPDYGLSTNSLWNTQTGNSRFDANYTFAGVEDYFYRLGLFNVGDNTKVNIQAGKVIDKISAFRYGLYASQIGFGYDRSIGDNFHISTDLFDPNNPEIELRGIFNVSGPFSLYAGIDEDLNHGEHAFLVGAHINK